MAFRADEAAKAGFEEAAKYLVPRPRDADEAQRAKSREALFDIVSELGPVVDRYPTWHPLVRNHDSRKPSSVPGPACGYIGLDHTIFYVNGFITCPYGDGQEVIESVEALPRHHAAYVTAEKLDLSFYNPSTTSILIRCNWERSLETDKTIPLSIAAPLMLEKEIPCWVWSEVAETWESMRPYFLGAPHGARSSLFVSQETGQYLKKIWENIIYSGMFGPINV